MHAVAMSMTARPWDKSRDHHALMGITVLSNTSALFRKPIGVTVHLKEFHNSRVRLCHQVPK